MAGVFISYRREDSPGHAGRIFDRLRARFGPGVVFMDVTAIDAGADFVDAIERAVGTCDVLLAIIGPQWAAATDSGGRKRLDNPNDFIRLEIAGALKRQVRVVPVLVDDAPLPASADLPDDLQPLLRRNAIELRDARWDADIDQLIASLDRIVQATDGPLRLEAPPRGRLRTVAAIAAVIVSVGAAALFGPRACAPATKDPVATATPTNATPTNATPSNAAPAPPDPKPPSSTPNVVGRSLSDAREILRRAGVDVARVLYRDDRAKAVDLVVSQSDVRSSSGTSSAVALTAIARAAVVIRHKPEDADVARGLLGALTSSPSTAGIAFRMTESSTIREEAASRVTYSQSDLAATAADIAKEATAWLRQNQPDRAALAATVYPPVVARTIIIGLPDRGGTSSSSAGPLPDVRGLTLADARRKLAASGRVTLDYKWFEDRARTPLEVASQTELPSSTPGVRSVVLDVVGRGTLIVEYAEGDRLVVGRLARSLRDTLSEGVALRLRPVATVRKATIGRVIVSEDALAREAATIARLVSSFLTKETGRSTTVPTVTDGLAPPRIILFGLPSAQ
jgi:hypothetical protein